MPQIRSNSLSAEHKPPSLLLCLHESQTKQQRRVFLLHGDRCTWILIRTLVCATFTFSSPLVHPADADAQNVSQSMRWISASTLNSPVQGEAALHLAALWGQVGAAEELIRAGADLTVKNKASPCAYSCGAQFRTSIHEHSPAEHFQARSEHTRRGNEHGRRFLLSGDCCPQQDWGDCGLPRGYGLTWVAAHQIGKTALDWANQQGRKDVMSLLQVRPPVARRFSQTAV